MHNFLPLSSRLACSKGRAIATLPRRRAAVALFVGGLLLATSAFASPRGDLEKAMAATGAPEASQAAPELFLKTFTAVVTWAKGHDLGPLISAAVDLRPDLQNQIVVAALDARMTTSPGNAQLVRAEVTRIVHAAVQAAEHNVTSLIFAAVEAQPNFAKVIDAAATSVTPRRNRTLISIAGQYREGDRHGGDVPFGERHRRRGHHGDGDDDDDDDSVTSPEKPPRRL